VRPGGGAGAQREVGASKTTPGKELGRLFPRRLRGARFCRAMDWECYPRLMSSTPSECTSIANALILTQALYASFNIPPPVVIEHEPVIYGEAA
jgi:hypothetical protein